MQTIPPQPAASAPTRPAALAGRRVIDAPTRVFHWLFALSFLGAYVTADGERWRLLHVTLGYTMAGLLVFRVLYGLLGPRQARLGVLGHKLRGAPAWFDGVRSALSAGTPVPWRQGQNLAMALAIVALLALVGPLVLSGVANFHEWGGGLLKDALEEVHEGLGNALLATVLAHLGLIATLSLLRGRNQATPMLTGRIEGRGPDLVSRNRRGLAVLLLMAVLAYWSWEWHQSPGGLVPATLSTADKVGKHPRHHDD